MRPRHKSPSIFNLSMVDILCCALGCVIFLWLVNLQKAEQKKKASARTIERLTQSDKELSDAKSKLAEHRRSERELLEKITEQEKRIADAQVLERALLAQMQSAKTDLAKVTTEKSSALAKLKQTTTDQRRLQEELDQTKESLTKTVLDLTKKNRALFDNQKRMDDLAKKLLVARADLKNKDDTLPKLRKIIAEHEANFKEEEAARKALQAKVIDYLDDIEKLKVNEKKQSASNERLQKEMLTKQAELEKLRKEQTTLQQLVTNRAADLRAARTTIRNLKDEQRMLMLRKARLEELMDKRFAGIELTGRNVIFLVDTSRSMKMLRPGKDDDTNTKWPRARSTLAKIMSSLPNLEKYQVITFANKTSFPLGDDGKWLRFEGPKSIQKTTDALANIDPDGSTNLHEPLGAAFAYRRNGLDTVYLLSDGLPTDAPNLTAKERDLPEDERSRLLAKRLRTKLKDEWNKDNAIWPRIRIHGVGFFFDSPDVGAFLWSLAHENEGSFVGMSTLHTK